MLPPWLALGGNIGSFMGGIFGVPIFGYFMATFALSPALAVIGGVTGNDTVTKWSTYFAADHHTAVFLVTMGVIALMSVLAYLGTRLIMKVCTWLVLIAAVGFVIDVVILLFTSHDSFVSHVDDVAGAGAYDKTVAAGRPEPPPEQGRLRHAQHDRRHLLRAHDHDLRVLGRVPVGGVQGRRAPQAAADGDVDGRHRQRARS